MKLLSRLLPWFVFAWLAGAACAADLQAIPPFASPVVDRAGLLDAAQAAQLDRRLREFAQTHGSQIAVLIVPTTQPESIEQYSIRVFDAWKIGRKQENDGILITVAVQDRKLRIDTGYGLEGAIPDAVAKRVVMEVISPKFRGGDAYGGLAAGVEQIGKLIEGEHLPPPPQGRQGGGNHGNGSGSVDGGGFGQVLLLGIVAATVVGGILSMVLGRFLGSIATAGIVGALAWVVGGSLFVALVSAVIVFLYVLVTGGHVSGWGGGGFGGGSGGGGGWSGGGGSAGGGGASGEW